MVYVDSGVIFGPSEVDLPARMHFHPANAVDRSTREIMQEAADVLDAGTNVNLSDPFSRFDRVGPTQRVLLTECRAS